MMLSLAAQSAARAQQSPASYRETVLTIQQRIESNDLAAAGTMLSAALRQYPADGGLENLLGIVEIQQNHVERAKQAFSQAVEHSPRLVGAYLNLARIYMADAESRPLQREDALHLYEKVAQLDPRNGEAALGEATIFMWDRRYQRSLDILSRLDADTRAEVRAQALLCADEAALGHREATDRAAASMVANGDLTEQDAMLVLPALRAAHRADLLDSLFSAAAARQPLSANGLRILGLAQEAEGKPEQARATLERVFTMDNSAVAPLVDLARIAIASKDYQGALGYLAHARALQPGDAGLAYEFGVVCLRLRLLGEALKAIGEAVKLSPGNPDYNFAMGSLTTFAQDPSQALPYLKKYHQLRPDDATGILALGTAYFQANDFENASVWLRQAANEPSTAAAAHYYLGSILRHQDHYDEALGELSKSLAIRPDQPDAYAELGQVYMQMKNYPQAERQLQRAIALNSNSYAANFALLRLYSRIDDPRRDEQSRRFAAIRDNNQEQYSEAMRAIEARPQNELQRNP